MSPFFINNFFLQSQSKFSRVMTLTKWFLLLTNFFGLNFAKQKVPVKFVIIFQIIIIVYGFYMIVYQRFLFFPKGNKTIFFLVDVFQLDFYFYLQVIFVLRAFFNRNLQRKIINNINSVKVQSLKCEKKFLVNVLIVVLVRVTKFSIVFQNPISRKFMIKAMFAELTLSMNDFLFEYFVSKLVESLRLMKNNLNCQNNFLNVKEEVLRMFSIKRELQRLYSFEILVTTFYNFIQLIISLYFICMRLKFNHLTRFSGLTDLYFNLRRY